MTVSLDAMYSPGAEHAELIVKEFKGSVILPGESSRMIFKEPARLRRIVYKPDLNRQREVIWKNRDDELSPLTLADRLMKQFIELSHKHIKRPS